MINKNLIFDVGMHKGEDTKFYLAKGFNVVAFEANPELVEQSKNRFKNEIEEKRLIIIEGAIIGKDFNKKVKFYKNKTNTVWGTVLKQWAERNEKEGALSEPIEVNAVNFAECLIKFGTPYYLKIDIEGMDVVCCESLLSVKEKPLYISIESEKVDFNKLVMEFNLFERLGYKSFNIIQQDNIKRQKERNPSKENEFIDYNFSEGSSGLFGKDLPETWVNKQESLIKYKKIFFLYKLFGDRSFLKQNLFTKYILKILRKLTGIPLPGWYDTHAKHQENDE